MATYINNILPLKAFAITGVGFRIVKSLKLLDQQIFTKHTKSLLLLVNIDES